MPFCADTRCGFMTVSLNVYTMIEELSDLIEEEDKEYFDELDTEEGSVFYIYVALLEDAYSKAFNSNPTNCPKFFDWLYENYNSIDSWEDVEREMTKIKNEERENEDFESYTSWALGSSGDQLFCSKPDCDNYCEGGQLRECLRDEEKFVCEECGGVLYFHNSPIPSPTIPNPPSPSPPSPNLTYEERMRELERQLRQVPERERSISPPHTVREPTPPPVYSPPTTKEVSTQTWIG